MVSCSSAESHGHKFIFPAIQVFNKESHTSSKADSLGSYPLHIFALNFVEVKEEST